MGTENSDGPGGRPRNKAGAVDGYDAETIDTRRGLATLDRILDKLRAAGVERVVVNAHYLADQISAHVEARSDETVSVIVEEGAALETGGGVAHALDQLGDEPFFVINGDSIWLDGMSDTLRRFAASWNADAMDIQLLLYRFSQVQGYHGLGDYTMTPDGLLRRREERRVAPYAYMGRSILHPRIFKAAPDGSFSLNILYDKAENQSRLYGILHDGLGTMSRHPPIWSSQTTGLRLGICRTFRTSRHQISRHVRSRRDRQPDDRHTQPVHHSGRCPVPGRTGGGVVDRVGRDPVALSRATILLPTNRAIRAAEEAFLRLGEGRPMLLPSLRPLADIEDEALDVLHGGQSFVTGALSAPPAISGPRRQLLLTRLILELGRGAETGAATPDQAARLATALARLIDEVQTQDLDFGALETLVPERYADHWQQTLDFLRIVTRHWPAMLEEAGLSDPKLREFSLMRVQAEVWRHDPPTDPVIVAGSTGSVPATAEPMSVVARLPQGSVVLPGLDQESDEPAWRAIFEDPAHPQHGMARLLDTLGVVGQT